MRVPAISLVAAFLVSGCDPATVAPQASTDGWGSGAMTGAAPSAEERQARWQREWQEAKQTVAMARDEAAAAGNPVPPELDRQVTDLLNRRIQSEEGSEARIEELQESVSDALRLAEILSIG